MMYYVIGGQYDAFNHGGANTILGAKRLATKCAELWDNWQGWHIPSIYREEDCKPQSNFYGEQILPIYGAIPVAVHDGKKWVSEKD